MHNLCQNITTRQTFINIMSKQDVTREFKQLEHPSVLRKKFNFLYQIRPNQLILGKKRVHTQQLRTANSTFDKKYHF